MNKQEAIKKLKEKSLFFEDDYLGVMTVIELDDAQKIISQIEEPQKVTIPKFVAEWIEDYKGDYNEWNEEARADFVFRAINDLFRFGEELSLWDFTINEKISEWTTKNAYKFITAILFGYEVEKEKLYAVEIPNPNGSGYSKFYLAKNKDGKVELFIWSCYTSIDFADNWKQEENAHLTESEIKKDFEWAWDAGLAKEVD